MQRFVGVRECTEEAKRTKGKEPRGGKKSKERRKYRGSEDEERNVRWEEELRKGREEEGGTPPNAGCKDLLW